MLIDISYFTYGPRHILNATTDASNVSQNALSVNKQIVGYIRHYQLAFLCGMLGDTLAVEVDDYLNTFEDGEEHVANEQYDLLCGKLRQSFADFVFFHILRDCGTQATSRGLVVWKNDNEVVSPVTRQMQIWNEMAKRNIRFKAWAADNAPLATVSRHMTTQINPFNL